MDDGEKFPGDLLYNPDHDWARVEGEEATFGITWYAQEQLGEIVFWDGAKVGDGLLAGQSYTELESVKAVSEVIAPMSGRVIAVNDGALQAPEVINSAPYGEGWLVRVALSAPAEADELLGPDDYRELVR